MLGGKFNLYGSSNLLNYDLLISTSSRMTHISEEIVLEPSEKNIREAILEFKFLNLSNFNKYFANPNKNNYMEGKKIIRDNFTFAKTEFKIAVFRTRRFLCLLEIWITMYLEIFRFKYKKLSLFCLFLVHLLIAMINLNSIHIFALYFLIIIILINHKKSTLFIQDYLFSELRSIKDLNPYYREPLVHTKKYLKSHRFLQIELLRKKLKPPEGIVSDLKLIKMGFNHAPIILHNIVNLVEKIKNLIIWYDQEHTKVLLLGLFVALVICHLMDIRIMLLGGGKFTSLLVWIQIFNQRNYYKKHLEANTKTVQRVLKQIMTKNMGSRALIQRNILR